MTTMDRRSFMRGAALAGGSFALSGPLEAFAARARSGARATAAGYGPLRPMGDLALPAGFSYRIISRSGQRMSDGSLTPTAFDGMAAFPGPDGTTVLIRNHENRRLADDVEGTEIPVVVPPEMRYDRNPGINGGNTKVVVGADLSLQRDFAVLGGTTTNCAGGQMPWGSWIACEEAFETTGETRDHGYAFEIDASADGPVAAVPIRGAGRFVHEAVAWLDGALYLTEDQRIRKPNPEEPKSPYPGPGACFYRYLPSVPPQKPGDLAAGRGRLQALAVRGRRRFNMDRVTNGRSLPVAWVDIANPEPSRDTLRVEALRKGAAEFDREEGMWVVGGRVYFDCTEGGPSNLGQVWEYDPRRAQIRLVYHSESKRELEGPDNLTVVPATGDLFLCEDADPPQYVRGLTTNGRIYDVARSLTNDTEFCGACFSPDGGTLFVNQQGDKLKQPAVTYAITGPWPRRNAR